MAFARTQILLYSVLFGIEIMRSGQVLTYSTIQTRIDSNNDDDGDGDGGDGFSMKIIFCTINHHHYHYLF